MTRRLLPDDEGNSSTPEARQGGSYPPDIARRRRQLGLPVTSEEHVAYKRDERPEPPVTRAQMAATLRQAASKARGEVKAQFLLLARQIELKSPLTANAGPIVDVVKARLEREPGEEG